MARLFREPTRILDAPRDANGGGNGAGSGDAGASGDSAPNYADIIARIAEIPEDLAPELEKALKGNKVFGNQLLKTVRQSTILTEAERLAGRKQAKTGTDESDEPRSTGKVAKLERDLAQAVDVANRLKAALDAKENEELTPEEIEKKQLKQVANDALAKVGEYEGELTRGKRREAVKAILDFAEDDDEGLGFTPKQLEELRDLASDVIDDQGDPDVLKAQLLKFAANNRKEFKKMSEAAKGDVESLRDELKSLTARINGETTTVTGSTSTEVKSGGEMPFKTIEEKWLEDPAQWGDRYYAARKKLGVDFN